MLKPEAEAALAATGPLGEVTIGADLKGVIEKNGFQINPAKLRLQGSLERQTVTGLTVNAKVNVPRTFIRDIRAIINDWRKNGLATAQTRHCAEYYRHKGKRSGPPDLRDIVRGKIEFLKMVRGSGDPVRKNLQRQLTTVWPDYLSVLERENRELKMRDLFISHASEDKRDFVRPLVDELLRIGLTVWYDEYEITIGDNIAKRINEGLINSRFGVVVLSPNFFNLKKTWPDREISALFAMEDADKQARVLPIWHNIDQPTVAARYAMLAGHHAWRSSEFDVSQLAAKFREFIKARK